MRDLLVLRSWRQAIDARQIDDKHITAGDLGATGVLLNCDTGKIGDFLAESGKPVEKSRFAGIWRPDQGNRVLSELCPLREGGEYKPVAAAQPWQSLITSHLYE